MSLSRAQNIFMPANINSIVILKLNQANAGQRRLRLCACIRHTGLRLALDDAYPLWKSCIFELVIVHFVRQSVNSRAQCSCLVFSHLYFLVFVEGKTCQHSKVGQNRVTELL